ELNVAFQRVPIQGRNRQLMHAIAGERSVLERIRFVSRTLEILFRELVGVDDDRSAFIEVGQIDFQGGRVHRDQNVCLIAGRANVVTGKVQLKSADAGQAAGRRSNLSRKIRQRRDVVA